MDSLRNKQPEALPKIVIEVFFGDCSDKQYQGNNKSDKPKDACGIKFSIEFNEAYQKEHEEILKQKEEFGLPREYYEARWESFAFERITLRTIPVKSSLIDASEYKVGYNLSDICTSHIIKNQLETSEKNAIARAYRELKKIFGDNETIRKINEKLKQEHNRGKNDNFGYISLGVDIGTTNIWEKALMVELDNLPLSCKGKGTQCMFKTRLALSDKQSTASDIILLEEPENHLSFSNLNRFIRTIEGKCSGKQILMTTHSSFVANKLGLDRLILMSDSGSMRMHELAKDTNEFFKKLPGYDTLRLILCKTAILVEGRSDELVIQRAYMDLHEGKLPIEDGRDVITVGGLTFLRFLEIADKLKLKDVRVVTDNDGHPDKLREKYKDYLGDNKKQNIKIYFDETVDNPQDNDPEGYNPNTLEPKLLKANSVEILNQIFGMEDDEKSLIAYMRENKVECALKIFESNETIKYPKYIHDAVSFEGQVKQELPEQ